MIGSSNANETMPKKMGTPIKKQPCQRRRKEFAALTSALDSAIVVAASFANWVYSRGTLLRAPVVALAQLLCLHLVVALAPLAAPWELITRANANAKFNTTATAARNHNATSNYQCAKPSMQPQVQRRQSDDAHLTNNANNKCASAAVNRRCC